MNFLRLAQDHNLDIANPGDRGYRQGWVNVPCPFCTGNPGYHLGYCADSRSQFTGRFVCWRCGGKGELRAIESLLKISRREAINLLQAYGGSTYRPNTPKTPVSSPVGKRNIKLPPNTRPLASVAGAVKYCRKRGFDIEELETVWQVQATGPGSIIRVGDKPIDYSYRLIIPIYRDGVLVSYQGRDWTGRAGDKKYLACPKELESLHHKDTLYGIDLCKDTVTGVLVEGVTDAWAVGPGAVACFGVKYREPQVRILAKRFREVTVLFDPDPAGKLQALKIINKLKERGVTVHRVRLPKGKDPADMNREELRRLLR